MDTPRWLDDREARAWRSYTRMRLQVQARVAQGLNRHSGLSEADYDVLVQLSEAPEDRMRPFQLCEALQWEKSRLSHQLTRMSRRGLVAREDCDSDARGALVALTASGRAAIEAAAPAHVEDVRHLFLDALSADQLDALADIAETVLAHLDAPAGASPAAARTSSRTAPSSRPTVTP